MSIKARPILMNGEMVRATLEGRKTQTRRIVKMHNHWDFKGFNMFKQALFYPELEEELEHTDPRVKCPFGKVGDLLYVRETIDATFGCDAEYVADETRLVDALSYERVASYEKFIPTKVIPSIHMPRCLSRLTLKITDIRVERLQDISEEDAVKEGVKYQNSTLTARNWFFILWEFIKGQGSWEANPWVWVIEFETIKQNVDDYLNEVSDD